MRAVLFLSLMTGIVAGFGGEPHSDALMIGDPVIATYFLTKADVTEFTKILEGNQNQDLGGSGRGPVYRLELRGRSYVFHIGGVPESLTLSEGAKAPFFKKVKQIMAQRTPTSSRLPGPPTVN
jgi:hypothetical protein